MLKPLIEINFGNIPIYFIMMLTGFLMAYIRLDTLLKEKRYSVFMSKKIELSFFFGSVAGIMGANVANWFLFEGLIDSSLRVRIAQGGFSFLFGLIVFLIVSAVLLRINKVNVNEAMDLIVNPILIAHFFGRIGCSLRGCCWGKDILFGNREVMFPAREIEAVFLLIMSIIIPRVAKKKMLWVYLFYYSTFRFVIEFFRGDNRGCLFGIEILSPSQMICLVLLVVSGGVLSFRKILQMLKKEEKYDAWSIYHRKNKKKYIPLPADCIEVEGAKYPAKKRTKGIIIAVIIVTLIVGINPLQMSWYHELRWKLNNSLSFITAKSSREEVIGDGSGTEIIPLSYDEAVDLESGLEMITTIDEWSDTEYIPWNEKNLENGDKIYQYVQIVNERPVLGTARILVTDELSYPQYAIGDAASQAFTTKVLDNYIVNGVTLEKALGEEFNITESMLCWYDSGYGLVAAKHVLFSENGKEAVMGAVLQEADNRIICFTEPYLGVLSDLETNSILLESPMMSSETNREATWQNDMSVGQFAYNMIDTIEIDDKQANEIILSTNQIAKKTDSLNEKLYGEIFAAQLKSVLSRDGYDEEFVEEICEEIYEYLGETVDEKTVKILPEEKKNTFTYKLNYAQDADIIKVENPYAQATEVVIESQSPVQVEVYSKEGSALSCIYVEDEEKIILYPEDGMDFVLKVSSGIVNERNYENSYSVTIKVEKQNTKVPLKIGTTLYRIEKAYNGSDLMGFMTLYHTDEFGFAEGVASAALVPMIDSCECLNEYTSDVDSSKEIMASILLGDYLDSDMANSLYESEMKVSYVSHVEREDGYLVKAKVYIEKEGLVVFNGFTRFKLSYVEENILPEELSQYEAIETLLRNNLFITEINTKELFAAFGEQTGNEKIESDIKTLYGFCEDYIDSDCGVDVYVQKFNESAARLNGHSAEKVKAFENFINRSNLSRYKQTKAKVQRLMKLYSSAEIAYELHNIISDPISYQIDNIGENNKLVPVIYQILKIRLNIRNAAKDFVEDAVKELTAGSLVDNLKIKASNMEKVIEKLDKKISNMEEYAALYITEQMLLQRKGCLEPPFLLS